MTAPSTIDNVTDCPTTTPSTIDNVTDCPTTTPSATDEDADSPTSRPGESVTGHSPTSAPGNDTIAITNELHRYCELVDAGRFAELGVLMEHCSFRYGKHGTAGPSGAQEITQSYRSTVITYEDGTPRTRHLTSNPIILIDGDTAQVRSVYTVLQQAEHAPLETIISGRYHDTFKHIEGRWRFTQRCFFVDLIGDLSRHLRVKL